MHGYRCDRCGTFAPGRDSQRDGAYPPEGWATVNGLGPTTHLCATCAEESRALLHEAGFPPNVGAADDQRPHSRACGIKRHPHGRDCAQDCPTCHGAAL